MGMIEDVLKALDRIPLWKRLTAMPTELDALRARVAALEARLAPATGDRCPRCRALAYALIESRPEPEPWGSMGSREYVYRCSACQYEDVQKQPAG